ncbi:hypothetical protein NE236_25330 [Actinoallomurus purpureus]|uniref:hypothetical protein n=1 Tax=Actinoallomurus purpureus TaxID=478114 RepID=UPI002091EEA9|nr:hypothetical protein [Actinoallomurus purpureus]MCO6008305.1 hypothetical protein [Actinoallomurus purpureus]
MNKYGKSAVTAVVAGMVALGGVVATASAASAAGSSACTVNIRNATYKTTTAVRLRKGPSTSYTSLGLLSTGTRFYGTCNYDPSYGIGVSDKVWTYGKVTSGANSGKWGWVFSSYLRKV